MTPHFKFTTVPDIFTNFAAACAANPGLKITTQPDLALIQRSYESDAPGDAENLTQWQRFAKYVAWLNERAPEGECYKVLYLTRHGKGYHNAMHEKVGTEAWDSHWSRLEGDGNVTWADAKLNAEGIAQATALSAFWSALTSPATGAPLPSTLYTSPLARCLETTKLIFAPVFHAAGRPFAPRVKELLREQMTDHTCDRRSSRSWIAASYPEFLLEDGFTEADELWRADRWEALRDHCARKQSVLEDIFAAEEGAFVSLSIHSYAIAVILAVCGADMFRVREGTSIAIFVKAQRVEEAPVLVVGDKLEGY